MKKTPVAAGGWTYNDVVSGSSHQQLFCKMQGTATGNRTSSAGPKLISKNLVAGGVGLSNLQFGTTSKYVEGQIACGMCIKATLKDSSKGFSNMNCELTEFETSGSSKELVFMVIDQCKDDICVDNGSWLDLDNYGAGASEKVMEGYTWTAVECPVSDVKITLAFNQFASNSKFVLSVFDSRIPVTEVKYKCGEDWVDTQYVSSIGYAAWSTACSAGEDISFQLVDFYGDTVEWTASGGLPEESGGQTDQYLVETSIQFEAKNSEATALYPSQTLGSSC